MEPEWIEHDGSAVCPVPAGHDVEAQLCNGETRRTTGDDVLWGDEPHPDYQVTHYRDWTAWEQSKMTKADDVPETGKSAKLRAEAERILRRYSDYEGGQAIYGRREVLDLIHIALAAHEPAPIDPLREFLANVPDEEIRRIADSKDVLTCRNRIEDMLRARSVTLDSKGEGA